jgi:hypothetical protein
MYLKDLSLACDGEIRIKTGLEQPESVRLGTRKIRGTGETHSAVREARSYAELWAFSAF